MKAKGCLWAAGGAVAIVAAAGALLAPTLVREGGKVVKPMAEIKSAEKEYKAFIAAHPWKDPPAVTVEEAQLDRFLALRKEVHRIESTMDDAIGAQAGKEEPSFREVTDMIAGVGGLVSAQLSVYVKAGMNPAEYRYLERVVFRTWRRGLVEGGKSPAAAARAAREIERAAEEEKSAALGARLRTIAAELRARDPGPPPGIPPEVHRLLMTRAEAIEALAGGTTRMHPPAR